MMPKRTERLEGPRVLVVEDEALIALEIQDRLSRLNYRVVGVEDTAEGALALIERARPDLVLMDIRLKGPMDGIEAAAHIRDELDIPVVYLTAHSDDATLQRAKATAPLGYVLKPFQERDLLVTIEMAIHRHALERRIRESELRYSTTLASIGDGVLASDANGRVTFLNPVAEALTGWRTTDALGMPASQVLVTVDETTREALENPLAQALSRGEVVRLDKPVLLVARDGTAIPIDDSAAPIVDPQRRTTGAVVAFRDIRQRRLAEDALRRAEEQLRQAQKMEAIGRLAGGVAHDFNNLLTVINGYSELLLQQGDLDAATSDLLLEIRKAGERSAALTRQLLAFGRRQILEAKTIDLNTLVAGVDQMLRRLIGEDIALTITLGTDVPFVKADPGQLEQVILNLVVNSRDAMPAGGRLTIETAYVKVEESMIDTRPEMPAGGYAMLAVSDTGTGMSEPVKAHLFEPFFTTKEQGKGTGLGLATVYGIVKQSSGYVYVYSEPGHGSTFKVYLPAVAGPPEPDVDLTGDLRLEGHETILLVEDEDGVRAIASLTLQRHGYHVLTASGPTEALDHCAQHTGTIDLLVTDVVMPGMSGSRLAEQLWYLKPGIRVLYISGYTDDAVVRHGVLEGEAAFLQKPFTSAGLARKVREVLDREA